ncbi:MAG: hypothetical protein JSS65_10240 [Armatimonadetes bacterium]|nr:hypothetical protein [Armatimonadota bacterium]
MFTYALAVVAFAKPFALAYTARYYLPGDAKSTVRAYICDENGANRTAISRGKADASEVAWAGPGRLVWIENGSTDTPGLWTAAIGGEPTKVRDLPKGAGLLRGWALTEPGKPVYYETDETAGPFWEIQPDGTAKQVQKPVSALKDLMPEDTTAGSLTVEGSGGKPLALDFTEDTYTLSRVDGGAKTKLDLPNLNDLMLRHIFLPPSKDEAFIVGWTHDSTRGTHLGLVRYAFATGKATTIFQDASDVDMWPGRRAVAWTTPRDLAPFGKKKVWTSQAWVGDMATGWQREVIKGSVFIFNFAVRPGATFNATTGG